MTQDGGKGRRGLGTEVLNQKSGYGETINILAKNVQDLERRQQIYNSYSTLNKEAKKHGGSLFTRQKQVTYDDRIESGTGASLRNHLQLEDNEYLVEDQSEQRTRKTQNNFNLASADTILPQRLSLPPPGILRVFRDVDITPIQPVEKETPMNIDEHHYVEYNVASEDNM